MWDVNCKVEEVGTKLTQLALGKVTKYLDIRCSYEFLGLELVETFNCIDPIRGANCPYGQTTVKLLGYGLEDLVPFIVTLAMALICISLIFCIKAGDRDLNDAPRSPRQAEGDRTSWTDDGEVSENEDESWMNISKDESLDSKASSLSIETPKVMAKVSNQSGFQSRRDQVKYQRHSNTPYTNSTPLMKEMQAKRTGKPTQAMLEVLKKRENKSETSTLDNPTPAMKAQLIKKWSRN